MYAVRIALITLLGSCGGAATAIHSAPSVHGLEFLEGCWASSDGTTTERWHLAEGGMLFGSSTVVEHADLSFFEQLRIESASGGATYTAMPRGTNSTSFAETRRGASEIVFENESHDYPQRIHYRRTGDSLQATISRIDGTDERSWSYHRCTATSD